MTQIKLVSSNKCFGGYQKVYSHLSKELECEMKFAIYLPPQTEDATVKLPVLYWLSGLTCNEQNFIQKAGAQQHAAEHGIIIVCPDTSPRNIDIPGQDDAYDFGSGAGFYVDAITDPWNKHYKMFTYVTKELIEVINHNFQTIESQLGIFGHSMGGHGHKAFAGYLGENKRLWNEWDATELVKTYNGPHLQFLIDQGSEDQFLNEGQLLPENLIEACRNSRVGCIYNKRDGYDHSYFFIASFIGEHIHYHAKILKE